MRDTDEPRIIRRLFNFNVGTRFEKMTVVDDDIYAPFGREWWENEGREIGTRDPRHVPFAAARYQGHNRTQSARLAGYSEERATRAGSEADRARAVKLLKIAAQNKAAAEGVTLPAAPMMIEEMERLLDDDIRRGTRAERLKATELKLKFFGNRDRTISDSSDGFGDWRVARTFLKVPMGAIAYCLLHHGQQTSISRLPLFHDIAAQAKREQPWIWDILVRKHSAEMQLDLRERERDPDWQRETREKIWKEIGVSIADADRKAFGRSEGVAQPTLVDEKSTDTQSVAA